MEEHKDIEMWFVGRLVINRRVVKLDTLNSLVSRHLYLLPVLEEQISAIPLHSGNIQQHPQLKNINK